MNANIVRLHNFYIFQPVKSTTDKRRTHRVHLYMHVYVHVIGYKKSHKYNVLLYMR